MKNIQFSVKPYFFVIIELSNNFNPFVYFHSFFLLKIFPGFVIDLFRDLKTGTGRRGLDSFQVC